MLTWQHVRYAAALIACLLAIPAYAQNADPAASTAPANLAYVEGAVEIVQDGVSERADPPQMLLDGDVVRTRNGRAEVVFADGTVLHLSHDSEIELLGSERLRLTAGRAIVRTSQTAVQPYVIDTPASSVQLDEEGEYDLMVDRDGALEVAVSRGTATVNNAGAPTMVQGGLRLTLSRPGARPFLESYNSARWDAFERWAYDRVTQYTTSTSAARLPYELRPYAPVLDQYGRWDYVSPHGYVWVPAVGISWRPYYDGFWSFTHFGWTWHGHDRFAWPTHHFGRWGFSGVFWYWIPARHWGPAWVSWSVVPGYVSWAPLGWNGHPAIGFRRWRDHPAYWPRYNPWRAWTIVPRDHFAPRRNARRFAIDPTRLDETTRQRLVDHAVPLSPAGDVAVPRNAVRGPGARGNVRRPVARPAPGTVRPANPSSRIRSGTDAPAFAPPPSWSTGTERPGRVRSRGVPAPDNARRNGFSTRTGGGTDAPEYAPPPSWSSQPVRRGSVRSRDGRAARPTTSSRQAPPARTRSADRPARSAPSANRPARSAPSASRPTPSAPSGARRGGAVPRGAARGAVRSQGAGGRASSGARSSAPRSQGAQGGARRRPPGV